MQIFFMNTISHMNLLLEHFDYKNIVCLYMHGYNNKTKEATKQKQEFSIFSFRY